MVTVTFDWIYVSHDTVNGPTKITSFASNETTKGKGDTETNFRITTS